MPSVTAVYSCSILIYKMDTNETNSCVFVRSGNPRQGYRRYIFGNGSRAFVGLSMTFLCTGEVEVLLTEWHVCLCCDEHDVKDKELLNVFQFLLIKAYHAFIGF